MRNPPKKNKVSRNQEINEIFEELLDIYRVFYSSGPDENEQGGGHNFLDELRDFVDENYSQSSKYLRYKDTMVNFREILEGYVQEEEVSSDDEEEEENEEESGGDFFSCFGNMLPGKDFLENSTIFKMAKELQDELKDELNEGDMEGLNDPQKVMQSMASMLQGGKPDGSGMGDTIGKVLGKLGQKMSDGSFPKEALQKDVENIAKSMGGLSKMFGGNLGNLFGGGGSK